MAAQVGYCGLDRQRKPLKGDEIRACWEATVEPVEVPVMSAAPAAAIPVDGLRDRTPVRRLEFVEVGAGTGPDRGRTARPAAHPAETEAVAAVAAGADPTPAIPPEHTWSLWGDTEP